MQENPNLTMTQEELEREFRLEVDEVNRLQHLHTAALEGAIQKAITWLVTVKADQPASIIADRARLALEALRLAPRRDASVHFSGAETNTSSERKVEP